MKNLNLGMGWLVLRFIAGLVMLCSCDGGEKALDEITGNRAVQQYHKSKKVIETVTGRQTLCFGC